MVLPVCCSPTHFSSSVPTSPIISWGRRRLTSRHLFPSSSAFCFALSNIENMAAAEAGAAGKTVMVVGIDDSEHSFYALQWTLLHFFSGGRGSNPPFKLVVVHAKPIATSVVGLAGPAAADVLPFLESDLKRIAARVMEKAKEICTANSVADIEYEVVEGDPRNVLCETVEKHHADMLVVGSHGYGAIKRAVLGSVSDYCAHHAHCTVMIVKKPKPKH